MTKSSGSSSFSRYTVYVRYLGNREDKDWIRSTSTRQGYRKSGQSLPIFPLKSSLGNVGLDWSKRGWKEQPSCRVCWGMGEATEGRFCWMVWLHRLSLIRRKVAVLPQNAMPTDLKVKEFVRFFQAIYKDSLTDAEIDSLLLLFPRSKKINWPASYRVVRSGC